jgi:precorrin-6Y C5,15-methyltransferase (decarboxylating)
MDCFKIHIIGTTACEFDDRAIELMRSSVLIIASSPILQVVRDKLSPTDSSRFMPISPLAPALEAIQEKIDQGHIVVVASGDPFFYGIGEVLVKRFGSEKISAYPAVSSMQRLFSRLCLSWHDARFVSLHGRKTRNPFPEILSGCKVCILTDKDRNPSWLATELSQRIPPELHHEYIVSVGTQLGSPDERVVSGTLAEIAAQTFAEPNIVALRRYAQSQLHEPIIGLNEDEIEHSRGLITKSEIRAAILHGLRMPEKGVFWDIGAGSGSVSVESARLSRQVEVYAVEKDSEQLRHIEANRLRHRAFNIAVIEGEAPAALCRLPDPDRVFIGGSGGRLADIIASVSERLQKGGRVIVAAVLETTREHAPALLVSQGLAVEMTTISAERISYPGREKTAFNPITLITGQKH